MFSLPCNTLLGELSLEYTFQYYDVPRLFTCRNKSGAKYLVLSIDDDYECYEWLYLPISTDRVASLIYKSVTLKQAFIEPEDGYLLRVTSDLQGKAEVERIFPEQLSEEDLPEEGVFLHAGADYRLGLGEINAVNAARSTRRETYNLHFYPWDTNQPELDIKDLGIVLTSFQELADALGQYCKGEPTQKGAIPADILEATKFRATQIFEGSFGIQLKSKNHSDLLDSSLASDLLNELTLLLSASTDEDCISNKLHMLQGRVASKYRKFLKGLNRIGSKVKVEWGSPNRDRGASISISKDDLKKAFDLVNKIEIEMSESVVFRAELLGLDVMTKRYRVRHLSENEDYAGKISEESLAAVSHSEINGVYEVSLKKIEEINSTTGAENTKWLLVGLNELKGS